VKTLSATADRLRQRRDAELRWVLALTLYRDRFGASPTSTTYYLSDRSRAKVVGGAGVLGQDWLPLVRDWGALTRGLEPLRPGATPATLDLVLTNTAPIGGIGRFTNLLRQGLNTSGADLAFGDAVLSVVFVDGSTEAAIPIAQLLVDDLTSVTEETVTLRCNGRETLLDLQVVAAEYTGVDAWPGCQLNGVVTQEQAELWFGGTGEGFHVAVTLTILRPGNVSSLTNAPHGHAYGKSVYFPVTLVFRSVHKDFSGLKGCANEWGYIAFENMPYWADRSVAIGLIGESDDLFDPTKGNGVQVWCADTPGTIEPTERRDDGKSTLIWNWPASSSEIYVEGTTLLLPKRRTLLAHAMSLGAFPLTFPVPSGRALIICTGNQDPLAMPLGTDVFPGATVSLV
jgi:hypothetical protein